MIALKIFFLVKVVVYGGKKYFLDENLHLLSELNNSSFFSVFCTRLVSKEVTSLQAEGAKPSYKVLSESPGIYRNVPVILRRGLSCGVWN